jgi:magnesium transporter
MKLDAFKINDDCRLERFSTSEISPEWVKDPTSRWLHVEVESSDRLKALLAPLNLHPLLVENCLETPNGPRVASYGQALYMNMPYFSDTTSLDAGYLSIVTLPTLVMTFHVQASGAAPKLTRKILEEPLLEASAHALFFSIIEQLIMGGVPHLRNVREQIRVLSRRIDQDPKSIDAGDIQDRKQTVDQLNIMCEDQLHCVALLRSSTAHAGVPEVLRDYFRELGDDLKNGQRAIARMEANVRDLRQQFSLTMQDTTNKRLNFLAVLSAIYLPPTLISGIFGMNFEKMPALHLSGGYYLALSIMLVLVFGQLVFFRRRGWF